MTDLELMREFVATRDEGAFGEIVSRHAELVYSAAVRQVGGGAMAEDVTQSVFILLAQKAGRIEPGLLAGWLVKAARFTAMQAMRNERRRKGLEQRVATMKNETDWQRSGHWERIESFLDEALAKLGDTDRSAVALRYLEGKSVDEVAGVMGVSQAAAAKRITRAVAKLRRIVAAEGVVLEGGVLGELLLAHGRIACPAKMVGSATTAALAGHAAAGSTAGIGILAGIGGKAIAGGLVSLFLLGGAGAFVAMHLESGATQAAAVRPVAAAGPLAVAPSATEPATTQAASPWEIDFPGGKLRLVGMGVGENPKQWFAPDGTPLKEPPAHWKMGGLAGFKGPRGMRMGPLHFYSFCFVGSGESPTTPGQMVMFQIPGARISSWSQAAWSISSTQINMVAGFPSAMSEIDGLGISTSSSPWKTVAMEADLDKTVSKKLPAADGGEVTFGVPRDIADGKCTVTMQIAHSAINQQRRFAAVAGDKEVVGQQTAARGTKMGLSMDIQFDCEAGAITGLEMQLRKLGYKAFEKIKLPAEK